MERNYLSSSFKDHGIIRSRNYGHPQVSSSKLKDYSWNHRGQAHAGLGEGDRDHDSLGGGGGVLSWPPRSYTCSFCKREFRSAQALGGHMNVHRRDRARLRQSSPLIDNVGQFTSSPTLNLNLCPNHLISPSPSDDNNNIVSPTMNCTTLSSLVSTSSPGPALSSSSPCLAYLGEDKNRVGNMVEGALLLDPLSTRVPDFMKKGARKAFFGAESLAGFKFHDGCKFSKNGDVVRLDLEIGVVGDHHAKEELDLELRLGCS